MTFNLKIDPQATTLVVSANKVAHDPFPNVHVTSAGTVVTGETHAHRVGKNRLLLVYHNLDLRTHHVLSVPTSYYVQQPVDPSSCDPFSFTKPTQSLHLGYFRHDKILNSALSRILLTRPIKQLTGVSAR